MAMAAQSGASPGADDPTAAEGLSETERKDVDESSRLSALTIFEVLRREGEDEMDRPATSLWWSGVAAGLSLSVSLIAQGVLQTRLPDTPWRPLVTSLGYTIGFLIAVMARHQLFTENTITAVLPVTARLSLFNLARMGRLWALVLIANLAGTLLAALFCSFTPVIPDEVRDAMLTISHESVAHSPLEIFVKAIAAGFLIAAMVWLLPSAQSTQFHVILLMTYVIAIGGFAHIVAGSFEGFMLVANDQLQLWPLLAGFALPTLLGNIIGGTGLFSLIAYAQVAKEMKAAPAEDR
jgi:formate/nitrite transporter FocA (FNT family)